MEFKLLEFIASISKNKVQSLDLQTMLFKDKVLDSINILNLIGYVEGYLGRRLTDDEMVMPNFESAQKMIKVFFNKYG
jgi:acyl carrier protein